MTLFTCSACLPDSFALLKCFLVLPVSVLQDGAVSHLPPSLCLHPSLGPYLNEFHFIFRCFIMLFFISVFGSGQ